VTALAAVATYLPEQRVPIEELANQLSLSPMQVKLFRRYQGLAEIRQASDHSLLDLLLAATGNLAALRGNEHRVRYVLHARSFPVVVPYPVNPVHELCRWIGLDHALAFTVTHHACASGLLAIDMAGRLLATDPRPDALALVLAGEKTFTHDARLIPETSIFSEGASACLVAATGPRDRLLAYAANLRGEFDDELSPDPVRFQREYQDTLATTLHAALDRAGLKLSELDLILPHNVNTLVWRRLCRRIGFPVERVVLDNVPIAGHVFCADAFLNYQTARERGLLRPGCRYLVAAAAAGLGAIFSAMVFEH
jgi:3-oxoacyl-[acyl-carrier-protein] synthase III